MISTEQPPARTTLQVSVDRVRKDLHAQSAAAAAVAADVYAMWWHVVRPEASGRGSDVGIVPAVNWLCQVDAWLEPHLPKPC